MIWHTRRGGRWRALWVILPAGFIALYMPPTDVLANPTESTGGFVDKDLASTCGKPPSGDHTKGKRDFRARNSSEEWTNDFRDFETYHLSRAERNMAPGGRAVDVMNNFHFVLRRSPNHQRAHELMIKWSLAGGRDKAYAEPRCFLVWGTQFVPDDAVVWRLGGYYFWKGGDLERAEHWWKESLRMDPTSADTHYNLGLFYFGSRNYEAAREHAWAAYQAGFPLPGLRNKLEKIGQWKPPPN